MVRIRLRPTALYGILKLFYKKKFNLTFAALRKIVSILLIFSFLVQATSQLFILGVFELNRNYIAANLCINRFESIPVCKGSCVLEKQLKENEQKQEKLPDLKTKEINLYCQVDSLTIPSRALLLNLKPTYLFLNISFISSEHLSSVFRPPSVIV